MEIIKQVILNKDGNSWFGAYINNIGINKSLDEILKISNSNKNNYFILDVDGNCIASQPNLNNALKYYNNNRILVHTQKFFI